MSLNGKHALITGSSRGIGRGIALKLAASGVKVAVHYYQNEAAANDTLAQVRKLGADGFVVQADVLRPEQITQMFRKVQDEFGMLDIFVSNARPEVVAFFTRPWRSRSNSGMRHSIREPRRFSSAFAKRFPSWVMEEEFSLLPTLREPYWWAATLGRHGFSQGSDGVSGSLLRGDPRQARHHGECDQSRMDRGQRTEHTAAAGAGSHQELAHGRVDSDGASG